MTTNSYFESSFTASEFDQDLYNDLIIESIQVHGRNYFYLPRTLTNFNSFFGEDSASSSFNDCGCVEMYLENVMGWEGEQSFISKFGLEIRDEATLIVARSRFEEEVGSRFGMSKPREGDIIIFPKEVDNRIRAFEISYVDLDSVFFQLGTLYVYRLKVKTFDYSSEQFNTGIDSIDEYEQKYAFTQTIELDHGTGSFIPGDIVIQGNAFEATVISFDPVNKTIVVTSNQSSIAQDSSVQIEDPDSPIMNMANTAIWYPKKVIDKASSVRNSDNRVIDQRNEEYINIDEDNPFLG